MNEPHDDGKPFQAARYAVREREKIPNYQNHERRLK